LPVVCVMMGAWKRCSSMLDYDCLPYASIEIAAPLAVIKYWNKNRVIDGLFCCKSSALRIRKLSSDDPLPPSVYGTFSPLVSSRERYNRIELVLYLNILFLFLNIFKNTCNWSTYPSAILNNNANVLLISRNG
jgi:hypothetical protein